jgi:hypothetical protein
VTLSERLEKAQPRPQPKAQPEWMRRRAEAQAEAKRIHGTDHIADRALVA